MESLVIWYVFHLKQNEYILLYVVLKKSELRLDLRHNFENCPKCELSNKVHYCYRYNLRHEKKNQIRSPYYLWVAFTLSGCSNPTAEQEKMSILWLNAECYGWPGCVYWCNSGLVVIEITNCLLNGFVTCSTEGISHPLNLVNRSWWGRS